MPVVGVRRPAWAEISRGALARNVAHVQRVLGTSELCAVIKANGYGHGAVIAASALRDAGVNYFAVAILDEALELRDAGIEEPILLLAEIPADTLDDAVAGRVTLTVGSVAGVEAAAAAAQRHGVVHPVHLKIDTGMGRMGARPDHVAEVVRAIASSPSLNLEGAFTHFPVADGHSEDDVAFTQHQLELFNRIVATIRAAGHELPVIHAANSAAALSLPDARLSLSRVGLALYGYHPGNDDVTLEPVLSIKAKVTAVRDAEAGERPSYGRRRALTAPARLATVPFGYADGYPRRLFDAGMDVLINGRRYPLAGMVTMDQLIVDCGDDDVQVGDEVVLLGHQGSEQITADEWARAAGTISWEILCGIGARVPRVVVD